MNLRVTFVAIALGSAAAVVAPIVRAAEPSAPAAAPSAEDRKAAHAAFKEGDALFKKGDFRGAAQAYETAYKKAPHFAPLWNAARAWESANEPVRAANLYAKYLEEAPPNAPDRNRAIASLKKLAAKLGKLDVHAAQGVDHVTVDDEPIEGDSVYVSPGAHVVQGRVGDRVVREQPKVAAGESISVALSPPAPEPEKPIEKPASPPSTAEHKGWSPVIVAFGGAVTGILAGLAVWSGMDTLHQKDVFDGAPTQDNLDQGKSKQQRTNLLIGAAAGVGAITAICAVFLVDWHGKTEEKTPEPTGVASVRVRVGPGAIQIGGAF
jgi:tetratricopeptide (TPR) repeat protein